MNASVKADIDFSKLEELRKRLPDLSDLDLAKPTFDDLGERAGETVDRLLGRRRRRSPWPRIAAMIGLVAVAGLLMAWLTWSRRSPEPLGSEAEPWSAPDAWDVDPPGDGLTAAEASLSTTGGAADRA